MAVKGFILREFLGRGVKLIFGNKLNHQVNVPSSESPHIIGSGSYCDESGKYVPN
jgi:hypothetical protein